MEAHHTVHVILTSQDQGITLKLARQVHGRTIVCDVNQAPELIRLVKEHVRPAVAADRSPPMFHQQTAAKDRFNFALASRLTTNAGNLELSDLEIELTVYRIRAPCTGRTCLHLGAACATAHKKQRSSEPSGLTDVIDHNLIPLQSGAAPTWRFPVDTDNTRCMFKLQPFE